MNMFSPRSKACRPGCSQCARLLFHWCKGRRQTHPTHKREQVPLGRPLCLLQQAKLSLSFVQCLTAAIVGCIPSGMR